MKKLRNSICLLSAFTFIACNQTNNNSGQTTPEGTTQTSRLNSDLEDNRTSGETDTMVSPGSNAYDLKTNNMGSTGNTADENMQNQQSTHGRSTQSGDNGSGQ